MQTFDRLWRSQRGLVGGLVVALILAVGTLAPAIAPYSYSTQSLLTRLERPSAAHWLGTDGFGRDILTRVIWGGRVSLEIGLLATGLSVIVGTVLGGIADAAVVGSALMAEIEKSPTAEAAAVAVAERIRILKRAARKGVSRRT